MDSPAPWPAPAKLNLMLRILGRRADGYHELQTVFQFLEYADELSFEARADGRIRLHYELPGVPRERDIVLRAATLLQQQSGTSFGADIHLDKRLPMGGGLGGGSSDAATTLMALNRLWDTGLDSRTLQQLGLKLGADVPVFVGGQSCWAEGVGEILTPLELSEPWFLVIIPDCHVSTASVFADPELTRHSPLSTIPAFLAGDQANDCQPLVRRRYPEVARALDWLERFSPARLTGTGACVFAVFESWEAAEEVRRQVPCEWGHILARGRSRSPLLRRLEQAVPAR